MATTKHRSAVLNDVLHRRQVGELGSRRDGPGRADRRAAYARLKDSGGETGRASAGERRGGSGGQGPFVTDIAIRRGRAKGVQGVQCERWTRATDNTAGAARQWTITCELEELERVLELQHELQSTADRPTWGGEPHAHGQLGCHAQE